MFRTLLKVAVLMLTAILISACTTTKPLPTDGSAELAADEGLLAVRFVSNCGCNENPLMQPVAFRVSLEDAIAFKDLKMRNNDDAQLVALPAGEYTWHQTTIGDNYLDFSPDATFTINPGQVTYVGDITLLVTLNVFSLLADELSVKDNRDETLSRLRVDYGELLDNYPLSVQIANLEVAGP